MDVPGSSSRRLNILMTLVKAVKTIHMKPLTRMILMRNKKWLVHINAEICPIAQGRYLQEQ